MGRSALRTILFALLFALLFGVAVGTLMRRRMEQPTRYIGLLAPAGTLRVAGRALFAPALPLHVAAAVAGVLEPCEDEEQVG